MNEQNGNKSSLSSKRPTATRRVQFGPKTVIREVSPDENTPIQVQEQVITPAAPLRHGVHSGKAEAKAKAEAEAEARAKAEAKAKAEAEAKAKAEAEARAKAKAAAKEETAAKTKATEKQVEKASADSEAKQKKKRRRKTVVRVILRTLLVIFTLIALLAAGLCMVMNKAFNGPSETARDVLTMSMLESSGMKWVPALFIGEDKVEEIRSANKNADVLPEEQSDPTQIVIERDTISGEKSDLWKDYPDGIRIVEISGDTYNAHLMMIRDPSTVYLATSTKSGFKRSVPGTRINKQIVTEGAVAAINGGAFFDNGTSSPEVGSTPCGLVLSGGKVVWDDGNDDYHGFVGFNNDDILVVAQNMTAAQAKELGIRDGCAFGPVLLMNGTVNEEAYNANSGYNPRTAIGQTADGTVLFLCIDGRQTGSLGGTYADATDILVEYGAVNACNLDGGSSSVMLYKDVQGRYGDAGQIVMINSYSLLQEEPRKMPTFFMVRPGK